MLRTKTLIPFSFILLVTSPSWAADVVQPPPAPTWTIGIEGSPEFYAINNGSNTARSLADSYFKFSVSHTFDNNFIGGLSFQPTFKTGGKSQYYSEATVGYKFKLTDSFTLTPSLGLGYTWHDTGIIKGADSNAEIPYYALYLAGDWKLSKTWTWNVFNVRYRNAFEATWETPKVATGLSYNIDSFNTVYASVGYSWKKLDTTKSPYNDLSADKFNIAIGYKHSL
ncbi:hypothetical protein [Mesorhizobium sp. M1B.F.Ca.ET.045.04.1.1]|uniref:hypothetical protein n=1 Tax=Mesorhizobium sp. M1B.F.Ca.ET.045.04.1.1 TaxID=2493673 RepID=UPI000F75B5BC|nr:hypothetical protein [Mesorhizobium sp. M1B.F.Ca.ET.045.04.1.1]AZO32421.1 hypothetical protein EJ071_37145 [Mesorhizobium sp. M1B.F.Ca.ET.045.04.1.1]